MLNVVVTGASNGIGYAATKKFLLEGYFVYGIDLVASVIEQDADISPDATDNYHHYIADVADSAALPDVEDVAILVNNAGVQNTEHDIQTNLVGLINTTEKYALQNEHIKSVVNLASVSAHNGAEFGEYVASKGGVLSYTVWTAKQLAKYGATCNSLSFGGVVTDLNKSVIEDETLWNQIMDMTPMRKWATPEECADWIYFLSAINHSCSGQDIIVDNLEMLNHTFVWN